MADVNEAAYTVGNRKLALLCEGHLDPHSAKTATGLIIWCPDEVVAVVDSTHVGQPLEKIVGFGKGIPVVASVAEAVARGADQLVVGVANQGGILVPGFREMIIEAIQSGLHIVNGLHEMLADDPQLAPLARKHGVRIYDLRAVPPVPVAKNRAKTLENRRILSVGSDCNCGKMCTTLMLTREFKDRGLDAWFVATGQTGIMISGAGYAIDRAISDFAAGIAEKLVLDTAQHEWVFVEGQGSIDHPGYSGVTLSLLHGSAPQALILCHAHGRIDRRHDDGSPLMAMEELRHLYETISTPILPAKVVGVSLITRGISDGAARAELDRVEKAMGVPATDPLRFGVSRLADALVDFYKA